MNEKAAETEKLYNIKFKDNRDGIEDDFDILTDDIESVTRALVNGYYEVLGYEEIDLNKNNEEEQENV